VVVGNVLFGRDAALPDRDTCWEREENSICTLSWGVIVSYMKITLNFKMYFIGGKSDA